MRQVFTIACLALCSGLLASPASAQIPQTFTNLQVLPKDISRAQLVATMRGFAGALGVRCTHCHVGPDDLQGMDFGTDEKQNKQIARTMLRMVRSINADFVSTLPAAEPRQQVTCLTCHRRETKPPRSLPDLLLSTITARGVPAAIEQYQKLRAEMMDAGLYDFRERFTSSRRASAQVRRGAGDPAAQRDDVPEVRDSSDQSGGHRRSEGRPAARGELV
jgi:hypothetical protein